MIKDNKNNKNKDIVIHSDDLVNNQTLKVFKAEYYNEAEDPDLK
jgi:precorrin-4 methylase